MEGWGGARGGCAAAPLSETWRQPRRQLLPEHVRVASCYCVKDLVLEPRYAAASLCALAMSG
jgi:hypothetical protein